MGLNATFQLLIRGFGTRCMARYLLRVAGMPSRPRQRPRFAVEVTCRVEVVMAALREQMEGNAQGVVGTFSRRHGVLKIPPERRRFWSPELSLGVEPREEEDEGARVRGRFAPHPQIWTGFVFTYLTLFLIGLSGLVYGLAQVALAREPDALLVPVVALGLSAFVYGATFIGQGLGSEEMYLLRSFLDDCLERAEARGRERPRSSLDAAQL